MWMKSLVTRSLGLALCSSVVSGVADAQSAVPSGQRGSSAAVAPRNEFRVPAVRWFADRPRQYVLIEPFKYIPPRSMEPIVVPAGFVTDFASIPGPLQGAFGPSVHDLPALVHDYLYWRQSCSRTQADEVFYVALDAVGVSSVRRMMIRLGLSVGGPTAFRENARERKERLPRIIPAKYRTIPLTTWERYRRELRREGVQLDTLDSKPPAYCRG